MFSFRETYFRWVGLLDWKYARTQFLLSVSRNRYGFTLAGYRNEKSATDPALVKRLKYRNHQYRTISQRIPFIVIYKTCGLLEIWRNLFKISEDFKFLTHFQQSDKILFLHFCVFTGFKNVSSLNELDRSSPICTDTKH